MILDIISNYIKKLLYLLMKPNNQSTQLSKIPSVLLKYKFDSCGMAITKNKKRLVPTYIGSQKGFSNLDVHNVNELEKYFYPELLKKGILPLCPFSACAEYLDMSKLNEKMTYKKHYNFWSNFNSIVGHVNYETLMPRSFFMIALFDGGHSCDDGLCSEVAYYAEKFKRPVFGIRTDVRLGENIAAVINPAVRYFLDLGPYNGKLFYGSDACSNALKEIGQYARSIVNGKRHI